MVGADTIPPLPENDARERLAKLMVAYQGGDESAFETFYAECQSRLPDDQQLALTAAREQFLQALA